MNGGLPKSRLGNDYQIQYGDELALTSQLKYFISKIDNGKIEIANGDSAVEVMKVLEMATKSLISKRNF